jgi:hypothetical protein
VLGSSRGWLGFVTVAACCAGLGASCIAIAPTGIHLISQEGPDGGTGGGTTLMIDDAGPPPNPPLDAGSDPHAVVGAQPSHGPFTGGGAVLISGRGFTSAARIWFGTTEVNESTTVPVSPTSVQVVAPPGVAGSVDLTVQDGNDASTKRTLPAGYTYDQLYANPSTGPVPGGTVIEILGQGTSWNASSVAKIDQKPCTTQSVDSPTQITCTVPAGSPGSKTVSVTTGAEDILVLDAYTYQNSTNGFKGGLSGAPLAGQIKVLVFDNYSGDAVPGAHVIVGGDIATALQATADASGVAVIQDPSLNGPRTVTIAGHCHSPISFVAEPVDTVTAYLDPVLTPACAGKGDPPPVGGQVGALGQIQGQLVWPLIGEFKKGGWSTVPLPIGPHESQKAYVFAAAGDPTQPFQLPDPSTAVTPTTPGTAGYDFTLDLWPGNQSLYAVAGIEDDSVSPPRFEAYVMGAINGIPVLPNQITTSVFIQMDKTLDQALTMTVAPPAPGPKGPDRLVANVAVLLGPAGYALLPAGLLTPFLPVQGTLSFVGMPGLDGDLQGSLYISTARAVTGPTWTTPTSVIAAVQSTTTSVPVDMSGFVGVPTLTNPSGNAGWDGMNLATRFATTSATPDLTVYDITSGNGLVHWLIAAAGGSQAIVVPNLAGYAFPEGALPSGPISIAVYGAKVTNLNYGALLYKQLRPQGMAAYSLDYFDAFL